MPSPKPRRTIRRIVKVASLGFAGLLAGLLSGCTSSSNPFNLLPARVDTGWQSISLAESPGVVPPSRFESHAHLTTSQQYLGTAIRPQYHASRHGF
jgi:hypothetical protein